METTIIERLKIAANQFYLNKYLDQPTMTDEEYDALVRQYEAEGGSVKELVEWEKGVRVQNTLPIGLSKISVSDNNLSLAVKDYLESHGIVNYYLNFKYDGGSIIGFYKDGKLQEVRSTPDEAFGIIRTKVFWDIFPHEISNKDIIAIQGEALVDSSVYGQLARGKANGLLNSVNQDEEAASELFVRAYKVYFKDNSEYDFDQSCEALKSIPCVVRTRNRRQTDGSYAEVEDLVFSPSINFSYMNCPQDALTSVSNFHTGKEYIDNFQVDGVVMYFKLENGASQVLGFKFYYTESAITTVTNIVWNKAGSGSWQPKLNFETVVLNDKNISQAASGGFPNLQGMKMGRGAKIRVILSNMTIPKVIEVIEPSEDYQIPTCECGHKLNPDKDLFGSGLKCTELDCSQRYAERYESVTNWLKWRSEQLQISDQEELLKADVFGFLNCCLNIDRWDSKSRCNGGKSSLDIYNEIIENLPTWTADDFKLWVENRFYLPGLTHDILNICYFTAFKLIKHILTL